MGVNAVKFPQQASPPCTKRKDEFPMLSPTLLITYIPGKPAIYEFTVFKIMPPSKYEPPPVFSKPTFISLLPSTEFSDLSQMGLFVLEFFSNGIYNTSYYNLCIRPLLNLFRQRKAQQL